MRSKFGFGSRDVEKAPHVDNTYETHSNETSDGAVPGESFEYGDSMYAKLQRLAGKVNVEQRGIERVPDNERTDTSYFNIGSMVCLFALLATPEKEHPPLTPIPLFYSG
jgi:hypothetical protein